MKISDEQWNRIWWRQWLLISSFLINWFLFYFLAATYAWPSLSAVENIIYFFIGGTAIVGFGGWLANTRISRSGCRILSFLCWVFSILQLVVLQFNSPPNLNAQAIILIYLFTAIAVLGFSMYLSAAASVVIPFWHRRQEIESQFRFSLKGLLIASLVVTLPIALFGNVLARLAAKRSAIQKFENAGWMIQGDDSYDAQSLQASREMKFDHDLQHQDVSWVSLMGRGKIEQPTFQGLDRFKSLTALHVMDAGSSLVLDSDDYNALATNPLLRVLKLHVSDLQGIEDKFGWQVEEFDVRSNEITVAQYESIGRMHRLTDLKLETGTAGQEALKRIGKLKRLKKLELKAEITGGLKELSACEVLADLVIDGKVDADKLPELAELENLQSLTLLDLDFDVDKSLDYLLQLKPMAISFKRLKIQSQSYLRLKEAGFQVHGVW